MGYLFTQSVQCPVDCIIAAESRAALHIDLLKHLPFLIGIPDGSQRISLPHIADQITGVLPVMEAGTNSGVCGDDRGKNMPRQWVI